MRRESATEMLHSRAKMIREGNPQEGAHDSPSLSSLPVPLALHILLPLLSTILAPIFSDVFILRHVLREIWCDPPDLLVGLSFNCGVLTQGQTLSSPG